VRDQTTIGNARPVVDRAIVDVVSAAGGAPVVAVSGFDRISACSITPVRRGADYKRVVHLFVPPGSESAVLDAIARGLPHSYGASAGTAALTLYADAGDYVAVTGTVPAPGQVQIQALTGCRPTDGAPAGVPPAPAGSPQVAAMGPVLAALGAPTPAAVTVADLACPGGTLRTVQATLPPGHAPASLATALGRLSAAPAAATPTLYAYRDGPVDLVVQSAGGTVTISATTRCG